jgi:uncharacterized protein (DUF983 family)
MNEPIPKLSTVLWRGWRRRCPHCGQGPIYQGWVKLRPHCSHCGLKYLADEGDLWAFLVIIDRAAFLFPLVVLIYFRLNNPATFWFYFSSAAIFFALIYTLPHRNGMGLGLDYLVRRHWGDLAEAEQSVAPKDSGKS